MAGPASLASWSLASRTAPGSCPPTTSCPPPSRWPRLTATHSACATGSPRGSPSSRPWRAAGASRSSCCARRMWRHTRHLVAYPWPLCARCPPPRHCSGWSRSATRLLRRRRRMAGKPLRRLRPWSGWAATTATAGIAPSWSSMRPWRRHSWPQRWATGPWCWWMERRRACLAWARRGRASRCRCAWARAATSYACWSITWAASTTARAWAS